MSATKKNYDKDENNILSLEECKIYCKDYNNYIKGKQSKLMNPKTNRVLNDSDRMEYIYYKCYENFKSELKYTTNTNKTDLSNTSISASAKTDNKILLDSNEKIQNIILIPLRPKSKNITLIRSCFTKPIEYEEGLIRLRDYLYYNTDISVTQNIYYKIYHNIIKEINAIIFKIYSNNTFSAALLTRNYDWTYKYSYNPFSSFKSFSVEKLGTHVNIIQSIKDNTKELKKMWSKTKFIPNKDDIRVQDLREYINDELKSIILYSESNRNIQDIERNLDNNLAKYMAYQFILLLIRDVNRIYYNEDDDEDDDEDDAYDDDGDIRNSKENANEYLYIINYLGSKQILAYNNFDNSLSASKSISWSGTPRSSSSGHSHFQSNANIQRYKKTKAQLVAEINANNLNDEDPYLGEKWENMPLNKLKKVISIVSVINNKTYKHAFYVRTLYKFWRYATKSQNSKIPFVNPYNRIPFTEENKNTIMTTMMTLYPNITRPSSSALGRKDVYFSQYDEYNYRIISFFYILKIGEKTKYIPLINLRILYNYIDVNTNLSIDIEPEFIPIILFENIEYLFKNKKLFGKDLPIKPLPVLIEYNNTIINSIGRYMDFFRKIRDAKDN